MFYCLLSIASSTLASTRTLFTWNPKITASLSTHRAWDKVCRAMHHLSLRPASSTVSSYQWMSFFTNLPAAQLEYSLKFLPFTLWPSCKSTLVWSIDNWNSSVTGLLGPRIPLNWFLLSFTSLMSKIIPQLDILITLVYWGATAICHVPKDQIQQTRMTILICGVI